MQKYKSGEGDDGPRAPRPIRALVGLGLIAILGVAVFTALGAWQLHRRAWKLDLIDRVEQRVQASPVIAPGPAAWPFVTERHDAYRHIYAHGVFLHDRETLVHAATVYGSGYWVMTPLRTDQGFVVLVNRGFVPAEMRDPELRASGQVKGDVTTTGLMRMTEPKGGILRANDPAAGRWYSRDVAAIATARGLSNAAPYFIDADGAPNPGGLPIGGLTVISFPNNHLIYAITWFGLALLLAGATAAFARSEYRLRLGAIR